jgi:hypothetical protein
MWFFLFDDVVVLMLSHENACSVPEAAYFAGRTLLERIRPMSDPNLTSDVDRLQAEYHEAAADGQAEAEALDYTEG